jgi:thiol:disulfide interchange protein DsbG
MNLFLRKGMRTAAVAFLVLCFSFSSFAAGENIKSHDPDPSANPVLAGIAKLGAKLYYLGNRAGLDGWLIIKDGQMQIAYAAPKSQQALVGALFGPDGENITADQIQTLMTTNKEVNALLTNLGPQPAPANGAADPMAQGQNTAAQATANPATLLLPPGERLMKDLQNAAGVNVGDTSAPLLLMIMDPDCPHCQATWRALRNAVFKNNLQIRLVPTGAQNGDHERAAAQLLHIADPLNGWDKYVAGDKSQLSGTPDATLITAIRLNNALIDSWHVQMTPYLVYRAKDGRVKIVEGEPEQPALLLSDIK